MSVLRPAIIPCAELYMWVTANLLSASPGGKRKPYPHSVSTVSSEKSPFVPSLINEIINFSSFKNMDKHLTAAFFQDNRIFSGGMLSPWINTDLY